MARVGGKGVGKKGRKCSPSPLFPFFGSRFISRAAKTENLVLGHSLLRNSTETLVTVTQATISLVHLPTSRYQFYQEREARAVDFYVFCGKSERESESFRAGAPGGGGTPIHYLYEYVPPNGVVILKLLI